MIFIVGGLSILGSVFTDFSVPKGGGFTLHTYRLITGVVFLGVAYGMYTHQRWSLWLYGIIVFIGFFLNFTLAIAPALLVIYLYTQRKMFTPGILDEISNKFFDKVQTKYNSIFYSKQP
ncbi:MAG: hypothetical protein KBC11_01395 [Candidatus Pacebacteria bacterium]|nr:hypothetical protein [Candidatus Paceibacterota bacterium]